RPPGTIAMKIQLWSGDPPVAKPEAQVAAVLAPLALDSGHADGVQPGIGTRQNRAGTTYEREAARDPLRRDVTPGHLVQLPARSIQEDQRELIPRRLRLCSAPP